jgi:hypothetical protein
MGAFSVAFDIIIVGTLALPWVILVIQLFFSNEKSILKQFHDLVKEQKQFAVAGVLLFAMTYALGSAESRIAQDFFDDNDLYVTVFGRVFRVGVTESSIRIGVFCHSLDNPKDLGPKGPDCNKAGQWMVPSVDPDTGRQLTAGWINDQEDLAGNIFKAHEAAVLLQGTDQTERIRQYHDQIMVLRGAAFSGALTFALLLFWWSAQFLPGLGWAASFVYACLGGIALHHHLSEAALSTPPYMEFTLIVIAVGGGYILWKHRPKERTGHETAGAHDKRKRRFGYLVLAGFITLTASLGWWATQVLYDQQVIYSYKVVKPGSATPSSAETNESKTTPSQK